MEIRQPDASTPDIQALVSAEVKRQITALNRDAWGTPGEAAAWARMSKAHLLRLCRQGQGPDRVGAGRLMRFRRSAVDRWLNNQAEVSRRSAGLF